MLPLQFFSQNAHFVISLLGALVSFAVFWLYFDAWTNQKSHKDVWKWVGFLLLAIGYVVHATTIEQSILGESILGSVTDALANGLKIAGFISIIIGQLVDPLQKVPEVHGLDELLTEDPNTTEAVDEAPADSQPDPEPAAEPTEEPKPHKSRKQISVKAVFAGGMGSVGKFVSPVGALAVAVLYWRRATAGLERHLKPVAYAFAFLGLSEIISLSYFWRNSDNPILSNLVAPFGAAWMAEHLVLIIAVIILGRWVWQYLTERFMSQLFMIFTMTTLGIYLVTTVGFTFLLMRNIQNQTLNNLETAANVLGYALDAKKAETAANAQIVAEDSNIVAAVVARNRQALGKLTEEFLTKKQQSSLIITSEGGQVLLRAQDPDSWGDSISDDPLVRRALVGSPASSVVSQAGVVAPVVSIESAIPIRGANNTIVGAVMVGIDIDSAFVDGVKHSTGLDSAVYGDNTRSATTFLAPDGTSRWVGVKEDNQSVKTAVLKDGKTFRGTLGILNRQFLVVYQPLHDIDNTVIGMISVAQPQVAILEAAGRSIELTFLTTAALLILSIIPAYLVAKYLTRQLE
jgi:hypothetical protein